MAKLPNFIITTYNGNKEIDETKFAIFMKEKYKLHYYLGMFYNNCKQVEDDWVRHNINNEIKPYFFKTASIVDRLFRTLKNTLFIKEFEPKEMVLHCNNASIDFGSDNIQFIEPPEFTQIKIHCNYNENSKQPEKWLNFLNDLLHEEDIAILQEYMGYCLIPSNKMQKTLFIIGQGGEGKSRIGLVMENIWGKTLIKSKIHKLEQDRFITATLVNSLVFIDDDVSTVKMADTGVFKELITNQGFFFVEQKGKDLRRAKVFTRFIGFANDFLQAVDDFSEGWYRRFIFMKCKPKPYDRVDNKNLINELYEETEEIFNWCIQGLIRLKEQNWIFSFSKNVVKSELEQRSKSAVDIDLFFEDEIDYTENGTITSKELYDTYVEYCGRNAIEVLPIYQFLRFFNNRIPSSIKRVDNILNSKGKKCRGYKGIKKRNEYYG